MALLGTDSNAEDFEIVLVREFGGEVSQICIEVTAIIESLIAV